MSSNVSRWATSTLDVSKKDQALKEEMLSSMETGQLFVRTPDGNIISYDQMSRLKHHVDMVEINADDNAVFGDMSEIIIGDNIAGFIPSDTNLLDSPLQVSTRATRSMMLSLDVDYLEYINGGTTDSVNEPEVTLNYSYTSPSYANFTETNSYNLTQRNTTVSRDGRYAVACTDIGTITLWQLVDGEAIKVIDNYSHTPTSTAIHATTAAFSPDNRFLVLGTDGPTGLAIYRFSTITNTLEWVTNTILPTEGSTWEATKVEFSLDGHFLAVSYKSDATSCPGFILFKFIEGTLYKFYTHVNSSANVLNFTISPNGRTYTIVEHRKIDDTSETIKYVTLSKLDTTMTVLNSLLVPVGSSSTSLVKFTPDGKNVLTCIQNESEESLLKIYNLTDTGLVDLPDAEYSAPMRLITGFIVSDNSRNIVISVKPLPSEPGTNNTITLNFNGTNIVQLNTSTINNYFIGESSFDNTKRFIIGYNSNKIFILKSGMIDMTESVKRSLSNFNTTSIIIPYYFNEGIIFKSITISNNILDMSKNMKIILHSIITIA